MNQPELTWLPNLPQCALLTSLTRSLWTDPTVRALWLGGSFARDAADEGSDVDLRVAIDDAAFTGALPASAGPLTERIVAHFPMRFGDAVTLHHVLLDDGAIYDFLVQAASHPPGDERRRVLACRDPGLERYLDGGADPTVAAPEPADPVAIGRLVGGLWMGQLKHRKVLARGLALLGWIGESRMRRDLMRLWYVAATGDDCGDLERGTIHTLTPAVRVIQSFRPDALEALGAPLRSAQEIAAASRAFQEELSLAGRACAERLGFPYPDAAEATVRRRWAADL